MICANISDTFSTAVRQKISLIIGIVFQGFFNPQMDLQPDAELLSGATARHQYFVSRDAGDDPLLLLAYESFQA